MIYEFIFRIFQKRDIGAEIVSQVARYVHIHTDLVVLISVNAYCLIKIRIGFGGVIDIKILLGFFIGKITDAVLDGA